jgi:hypothetical protein
MMHTALPGDRLVDGYARLWVPVVLGEIALRIQEQKSGFPVLPG